MKHPLLSRLAFAALMFLLGGTIGAGTAINWRLKSDAEHHAWNWPPSSPEEEASISKVLEAGQRENERYDRLVAWIFFGSALVGAFLGGWAWRAPIPVQFNCCYWTGLALLCVALIYVQRVIYVTAQGGERHEAWIAPLYSTFIVAIALILLMTALLIDRGHPIRRALGVREQ